MVLLHILHELEFSCMAAHVNYGLRGEESEADTGLVTDFCEKAGIPLHIFRIQDSDWENSGGQGLQEKARILRYAWFNELAEQLHCDRIATGHQGEDLAETIIWKLIRGAGPLAMQGIPVHTGKLIRPLLCLNRSEITDYAREQGINWREDSSNTNLKYTRNRIRHTILPEMLQLNPSLIEGLRHFSGLMEENARYVRKKIEAELHSRLHHFESHSELNLGGIDDDAERGLLLHHWLSDFGFSSEQIESLRNAHTGSRYDSAGFSLSTSDTRILLYPKTEPDLDEVRIEQEGRYPCPANFTLEVRLMDAPAEAFDNPNPDIAWLDAQKVRFPLICRQRRNGDRFQPLGMDQQKKLSDFLIDHKISNFEKDRLVLVCSGDDIVWVGGMRIDHRYRLTETNRPALRLHLTENTNDAI